MDPIEILVRLGQDNVNELRNIARAQGDMARAQVEMRRELTYGREVHQDLIWATKDLHGRVSSIERALNQKPEGEDKKKENILLVLLKEGREFIEAVASLKELAIAIAIIVASLSIASHPETVADLIHTYSASGHKEPE